MAEAFRPSSKGLRSSPGNEDKHSFGVLNLENVSDLSNSSFWLFKPKPSEEEWEAQTTSLINEEQAMPPSDFLNTPCDDSKSAKPPEGSTSNASLPKTVDGPDHLLLGAWPCGEDVDQSIHEVHFGENELEQFEDEFSDLGEDSDPEEHEGIPITCPNDGQVKHEGIPITCPNDGQVKQDGGLDASVAVAMKVSDGWNHSCDDNDIVNDLSPERARKDESLAGTCGVSSTTQTLLDSVYFQPAHGDDTGLNSSILDRTDAICSNSLKGSNMFDIPVLEKNKFEDSAGGSMIDLAYHMSLSDFSDRPAIPTTKDISGLNEDDFTSGEKMIENLEVDAAEFEKENASIRDLPMSGGSQSRDFSGICHSFISHKSASDLESSFLRASIGGVIASRTEALGALDGNAEVRPHFGTRIVTPPSNRRPPVLLSESFIGQTSGRVTDATDIGEQIQASGVSSGVDQTGFDHEDGADDVNCSRQVRDRTLTTDDLMDAHDIDATTGQGHISSPERKSADQVTGAGTQAELGRQNDSMPPPAPPTQSQETPPGPDTRTEGESWKNSSDNSRENDLAGLSVDDSSGLLNLSTIDKVLKRESVKPQDFIESIMQKSQAKSQTKMRQHSRQQRRAVVEATRSLSDSSDVDASKQGNSCASVRKANDGRRLPRPTRKPADGRSVTLSTRFKPDISEQDFSSTERAASDSLSSSHESSQSGSRRDPSGMDQHQLKGNKETKEDRTMQNRTPPPLPDSHKNIHSSYSGSSSASEPSSGTDQMPTRRSSAKLSKSCCGSSNTKGSQALMPSPSDMGATSPNHSNSLGNLSEHRTNLKTDILKSSSMQEFGVKMQKSSSSLSEAGTPWRADEGELDNRQNTQRLANSELPQSRDSARLSSRKMVADSDPDEIFARAHFEWTCPPQSSARSSRSSFISEARDVSLASQKTASTIKDILAGRSDPVRDDSDSSLEGRKKTSASSQPELNGSRFPRHSFLTNYSKPTCDYENDDKSDGVTDKKRDLRPDTSRSAADDQIQNSGSYRPPRSTPGFSKKGDPLQSSQPPASNTLPSQYLDSHLQSSTKPPSTGLTQYSGPFKVPQPPKSLFTSRSSLSFASLPPATEELAFNTSVSSQQPMDNTHSETRLFNNRDSIPGEPSNQSTPFYHMNHTKANTRHFQCLSSLAETPGNSADNHEDDVPLLVVPNEVRIPGVCCVNLSSQGQIPVRNKSSLWLNLSIEVNNLTMEGKEHFPNGKSPFIYEKQVFLAPFASEDIRVLFAPTEAGTYTAQLQFVSNSAAGRQSSTRRVNVVTLMAVAEMPSIEVYTESNRGILDFGSLPWGREKQMKLTLINKGRANIPIRLVISSIRSAASCFSFGKHSSTSISLISRRVCPDIPALKPTIINLLVPGLEDDRHDVEPVDTIIYFKSPDRQPDSVLASLPAETFLASLSIELDTPYSMISLGSIRLQASVGVARLHTPACYETITLRTSPGHAATVPIPLKNAGNIPLDVSLEILEQSDVFTVTPMQMVLETGQVSMFVLKFEPKQAHVRLIESLLLMFIEPDGPGYGIDIHGEILLRPSIPTHPSSGKTPVMLLSSRQFLAWGGVPVHDARTETFTLRNAADYMMQILLEIQDPSSQFKFLTNFGEKQTLSISKEFVLKPHEDCPVHVAFEPTAVTFAAAKLQIRLKHSSFKFTVPLSGYGGVSQLSLEGVRSNSQSSYWVNLGSPAAGRKMLTVIRVCNQGVRPAYVKAAGFEDLNLKRKLVDAVKLVIKPNGFCLKEKSACDVTIELTPSEKEASLCLEQESIMAVVAFFYGDELSRQLYRHALRNNPENTVSLPVTSPAEGLDFDREFVGDYLIPKETNVRMTKSDVKLFYTSMKYLTLSLVGNPVSSRPLPGERESHLTREVAVEEPEIISDMNQWLIQPETLILTLEETDVCPQKKLQIINYVDHELSFALSASAPFITVMPDHVVVKARNYIMISIGARPQLTRQSIQLPWTGTVSVTCQRQTKNISVLIRDAETVPTSVRERPTVNSQVPVSVVSPTNQPVTPLIAIATPNTNNIPSHLRVTQHKLTFRNARIQDTAEQFVEVRNISSHIIRWKISSFIPPYLKSPATGGEVIKMSYSVFSLPRFTGILEPHQSAQVRVAFTPRELGQHSQFWEIKATVVGMMEVGNNLTHTCKLELEGQCVATSGVSAVDDAVKPVVPAFIEQSSGKIMCRSRVLTISTGVLHFTVDSPGCQQQKKIKIGNRSKEAMKITVIPPANPFHIKTERCCEVKPRHYMNFPIIFFPQAEGFFEAKLSVQKPSGELLTLKLTGVCLDRQ